MKKHQLLACASAILLLVGAGCAEQPDAVADAEPEATAAEPAVSATASEPADQAKPEGSAQPAAAPTKFVPPIRGQAELGFTKPVTKRDGKFIVTTIKVKNLSATGSIAGLKVDEYWYDKGGNPVTGDTFRHRKPMMPGEIIEIVLRTPVNPAMDRNQYNFSHANGTIKTTSMAKLE